MISSAKEAREILTPFDNGGRLAGTGPKIGEAMGYLAALKGPEVRALVEAFEKIRTFKYGEKPWVFVEHAEKLCFEALAQYREAVKP